MKKIGMLFPGYGSQSVGMGKELYDASRVIQEYFEEASNCLNENFVKLCFASSDAELAKLHTAYPSIFLVSGALFALLQEKGIKPDVVAGYNLGLYSALFAAGCFNFPDGLYLLSKLAQFYSEALSTIEVDLIQIDGVERDILSEMCRVLSREDAPLTIAFYHNPTSHIVSGDTHTVEELTTHLQREYPDIKIKKVSPSVGLHSLLMGNVVEQVSVYLAKVDFHDLSCPLISAVDAQLVTTGQEVEKGIVDQLSCPIVWDQVMDHFADCDILIEVGPGSMLSKLAKKRYPDKIIISVQKQADIDTLLKMVEIPDEQAEL